MADNRFAPKRNVQGDFAAQARAFSHDAINLVTGTSLNADAADIPFTGAPSRGACLYVGVAMSSITVTMESGRSATFKGVAAGSFLPILVVAVTGASPVTGALADNDILALF